MFLSKQLFGAPCPRQTWGAQNARPPSVAEATTATCPERPLGPQPVLCCPPCAQPLGAHPPPWPLRASCLECRPTFEGRRGSDAGGGLRSDSWAAFPAGCRRQVSVGRQGLQLVGVCPRCPPGPQSPLLKVGGLKGGSGGAPGRAVGRSGSFGVLG